MMTADNPDKGLGSRAPNLPTEAEQTRYLEWVADRARTEEFWMVVREDIIEKFANLLSRELPDDLWPAACAQRDRRDYLIIFTAVLERLREYCGRIGERT